MVCRVPCSSSSVGDGSAQTSHFVFPLLAIIERLAAWVPPPRMHPLTHHALSLKAPLAPAASWCRGIVQVFE